MTVADPRQAAVFGKPRLRRVLLLFAAGPMSLTEAAAASGIELKRLHHHAQRLRRLGLLRVVGERRRAGRPMKLYQAAAPSFFVADDIAPAPFGERLARELRETLAADRARSSEAGMLYSLGSGGEPIARSIGEGGRAGSSAEMWQVLRLTPADARALTEELRQVLLRYGARARGDGAEYLAHAAVARRRPQ